MSSYGEPRYIGICKRVSAREARQEREILSAHITKREGLEQLVSRYHEIGREIEKEAKSEYACIKTINAKFVKRAEVAEILARQGIVVKDEMDPKIVALCQANLAKIQSMAQPVKQK